MTEGREREPSYAWVVVGVLFLRPGRRVWRAWDHRSPRQSVGDRVRVGPGGGEPHRLRSASSSTASAQALSGRWADRTGPRVILAASIALLGVGTAAVGSIVSLWQAYVIFGVLIMVAVGGASSPTAAVAVARWFTARRGLALGLVAGGGGAGQFVILPVMATLIQRFGWRTAFFWLGVAILAIALPVVLLLFREDPGQVPGRAGAGAALAGSPMALTLLLQHANFRWLALSFFVCGVTTAGLIDTHFIPHAQDHHVSAVTAATAFGVLSLVNMVFTTLSGAVSDRLGYAWLLGWIYAGRAVTLVYLVFARDPASLFVFAVAFGIVDFSTVAPTTALSTILFGRRSAGTVYGTGRAEPPAGVRPRLVRRRRDPRPHRQLHRVLPRRGGALGRRGLHVVGDIGNPRPPDGRRPRLTIRP